MPLEYLFDAELEYRPGMAPLAEHGEGQLIGSGDGSVHGQRVRGALRWTLFEGPGELICAMNPTLAIRAEDGEQQRRGDAPQLASAARAARVAPALDADAGSYRAFVQTPAQQDGQ